MRKLAVILVLGMLFSIHAIYSAEYNVDKSADNLVKFISHATIEDFEGTTNKIDGYFVVQSLDALKGGKLYFEVDLNSVDTGIGLRNRHMRENYLHTDKYPKTYFEGYITDSQKINDNEYKVMVKGKMFIHGVTKEMSINGTILKKNDNLNIKSNFSVNLSDFNIEIPKLMFMKIANEQKLVLDFNVKPAK